MTNSYNPANYEAWYHTPRGRWVGDHEFALLMHLLKTKAGTSLLDVGCGTGYFSRRFAQTGLSVTGVDPDAKALEFAREQSGDTIYMQGTSLDLPFADKSFEYTSAITSFCFIDDPQQALQEMWRVTADGLILGLLNRRSLLYLQKHGRGNYQGARWDTAEDVLKIWIPDLNTPPEKINIRTAILFPQGNRLARSAERLIPRLLPWGGFLAAYLSKK